MIEPETIGMIVNKGEYNLIVSRKDGSHVRVRLEHYSHLEIYLSRREAEFIRRALSRAIRELKELEA